VNQLEPDQSADRVAPALRRQRASRQVGVTATLLRSHTNSRKSPRPQMVPSHPQRKQPVQNSRSVCERRSRDQQLCAGEGARATLYRSPPPRALSEL